MTKITGRGITYTGGKYSNGVSYSGGAKKAKPSPPKAPATPKAPPKAPASDSGISGRGIGYTGGGYRSGGISYSGSNGTTKTSTNASKPRSNVPDDAGISYTGGTKSGKYSPGIGYTPGVKSGKYTPDIGFTPGAQSGKYKPGVSLTPTPPYQKKPADNGQTGGGNLFAPSATGDTGGILGSLLGRGGIDLGNTGRRTQGTTPTDGDPFNAVDALNKLMPMLIKSFEGYDPNKAAYADANTQFNPQIAAARQTIAETGKQNESNLGDIKNWFSQLVSQAKDNSASDSTALTSALGDDSVSNVISSLGGGDEGLKAQLVKAAAYDRSGLQDLGKIQKDYSTNMLTSLGLTGEDTARTQMNQQDSKMQQLRDSLTNLIGQKADALTSNKQKNLLTQQQGYAGLAGILQTNALLPSQMSAATLHNLYVKALTGRANNPTVKAPSYNMASLSNQVAGMLGVGADRKLPKTVDGTKLASTIGSVLQGVPGLTPGTPTYSNLLKQIATGFIGQDGANVVPGATWGM